MSDFERLGDGKLPDALARALASIRSSVVDRDESLRYAVNETLAWLNGPGGESRERPTNEDIARYSVLKFIEHQNLPVVRSGQRRQSSS